MASRNARPSRNQRHRRRLVVGLSPVRLGRPIALATVDDNTSRARRRRDRMNQAECIDVEEIPLDSSCIDLTKEPDGVVVDLTSPSPQHASLPQRRRNRNRQRVENVEIIEMQAETLVDDDLDLPELASFTRPTSTEPIRNQSPKRPNNPPASTSNVTEANSPTWACPICFDSLQQLRQRSVNRYSTVCGHVFCQPCLRGAISTMHKCPACRKKLTLKQIHPIFI